MSEGLETPIPIQSSVTEQRPSVDTSMFSTSQPEVATQPGVENTDLAENSITSNMDRELPKIDVPESTIDMFGGPRPEDKEEIMLDFKTKDKINVLRNEKPQTFYKEWFKGPSAEEELSMLKASLVSANERLVKEPNITSNQMIEIQREEFKKELQNWERRTPDRRIFAKTEDGGYTYYKVDDNGNKEYKLETGLTSNAPEVTQINKINEELKEIGNKSQEAAPEANFANIAGELNSVLKGVKNEINKDLSNDQNKEERQRNLNELLEKANDLIAKIIEAQTSSITESVIQSANKGEIFNAGEISSEEQHAKLEGWTGKVKEYFRKKADNLRTQYKASTWTGVASINEVAARIGRFDSKMLSEIGGPFGRMADYTDSLANQSRDRAQYARQVASYLRTGGQNG